MMAIQPKPYYPQFPWIRLWVTALCRGRIMFIPAALKRSQGFFSTLANKQTNTATILLSCGQSR
jgi:hypothetical protein